MRSSKKDTTKESGFKLTDAKSSILHNEYFMFWGTERCFPECEDICDCCGEEEFVEEEDG